MVKVRILISMLLLLGIVSHEIQAIKPQTWAMVTGVGVITGATTAGVIYHFAKKKPSPYQKPTILKTIATYMGVSTLGGLLGGAFTGTLGYFFTPYYRLRYAKNIIQELQNNVLVTNQYAQAPLYTHINSNSLEDYPLAATFVDLANKKIKVDHALDYLAKAKQDTHDATMLNDIQQTEAQAKIMQANTQNHINLLRQHNNFDKQIKQHRIAQREATHIRNETKYAHAAQTSANAQSTQATAYLARTINDIVRGK